MKHSSAFLLTFTLFLILSNSVFGEVKLRKLQKLRVLALLDVGAKNIGPAVKLDANTFRGWFYSVFKNDDYPLLKDVATVHYLGLDGNGISSKDIKEYLVVNPIDYATESVLVYYTGHGGFSSEVLGGHYLALSDGRVGELDLLDMFKSRYTMLLNDSCSSYDSTTLQRLIKKQMKATYTVGGPPHEEIVANAYKELFLHGSGQWVFRASSRGEPAWTSGSGSHFTTPLFYRLSPDNILSYYHWVDPNYVFDLDKLASDVTELTVSGFEEHKQKVIDRLLATSSSKGGSIASAAEQRPSASVFLRKWGENYLGPIIAGGAPVTINREKHFYVRLPYSANVGGKLLAEVTFHYPDGGVVAYGAEGSREVIGVPHSFTGTAELNGGTLRIPVPYRLLNLEGFPIDHYGIKVTLSKDSTYLTESPMYVVKARR
jgi:hypothetical protein